MLTSKQRAYLRALANDTETIFQIGKDGIGESFVTQIDTALEKRELIKLRVLENSVIGAREAADILAGATGSDVVQVIGSKIVLYRPSEKNPKIELPKAVKKK